MSKATLLAALVMLAGTVAFADNAATTPPSGTQTQGQTNPTPDKKEKKVKKAKKLKAPKHKKGDEKAAVPPATPPQTPAK